MLLGTCATAQAHYHAVCECEERLRTTLAALMMLIFGLRLMLNAVFLYAAEHILPEHSFSPSVGFSIADTLVH